MRETRKQTIKCRVTQILPILMIFFSFSFENFDFIIYLSMLVLS